MNIHTLTIDNFYPAPNAVRAAALATKFETVEYGGHKYHGISTAFQPEGFDEYLSQTLGSRVKTQIGFFRMGNPSIPATSHIHWDRACTPWACVWYLSNPPKGVSAGTSLWEHKATGLSCFPPDGSEELVTQLVADGNDETKWDMVGLIPQSFNRAAIYRSDLFHARHPKEAFGSNEEDSRLIYVSFFDYCINQR